MEYKEGWKVKRRSTNVERRVQSIKGERERERENKITILRDKYGRLDVAHAFAFH